MNSCVFYPRHRFITVFNLKAKGSKVSHEKKTKAQHEKVTADMSCINDKD